MLLLIKIINCAGIKGAEYIACFVISARDPQYFFPVEYKKFSNGFSKSLKHHRVVAYKGPMRNFRSEIVDLL